MKSWRLIGAVLLGWLVGLPLSGRGARQRPSLLTSRTRSSRRSADRPRSPSHPTAACCHEPLWNLHIHKNGASFPIPRSTSRTGLLGQGTRPARGRGRPGLCARTASSISITRSRSSAAATTTIANSPVNRVSRFISRRQRCRESGERDGSIDNMPNPDGIHNAGDLKFGKDGNLYISVGDGGCDYAGDSGCGSSNDAARDLHVLLGKVLRIRPDGGDPADEPVPRNGQRPLQPGRAHRPGQEVPGDLRLGAAQPVSGSRSTRTRRRPASSSTTSGSATWEEIDLGQAGPTTAGTSAKGHCAQGSTTNCGPPPAG